MAAAGQAVAETVASMQKLTGKSTVAAPLAEALAGYQKLALSTTEAMLTTGNVADQVAPTGAAEAALGKLLTAQRDEATRQIAADKSFVAAGVRNGVLVGLYTGVAVLFVSRRSNRAAGW